MSEKLFRFSSLHTKVGSCNFIKFHNQNVKSVYNHLFDLSGAKLQIKNRHNEIQSVFKFVKNVKGFAGLQESAYFCNIKIIS